MIQPIALDINDGSAYIHYVDMPIAGTRDLNATYTVMADIAADGTVVGIEILNVSDADQRSVAAKFAEDNGLALPDTLH
jgi:uncharacterized protein YuzE